MNRNLAVAIVVWMALQSVTCPAAPTLSFEEFKPVSLNGASGTVTVSNGVFRLNNSATNNGIYFVAQPFSGNGQISARFCRSIHSPAKIGLLFRQDTNMVSPFAGMFLTGTNTAFERLSNTKELPKTTVQTNETAGWLRVVREGTSFSGFYSEDGTNWVQLSADSIEMPDEIFVGLSVIGAGEGSIDQVRMTRAKLASPPGDSSFVMPTNILLTANVASLGTKISTVEFFSGPVKIKEVNSPPYSYLWTNALAGSHSVTAKVVDDLRSEFFTEPQNYELRLPPTMATFIRVDEKTKGNWKGVYGEAGFLIMDNKTNLPNYVEIRLLKGKLSVWQKPSPRENSLLEADSARRIASNWFDNRELIFRLRLGDGNPHRVALYFLDWDANGRKTKIQILDVFGKILDDQTLGDFSEGKYMNWLLRGEVIFKMKPLESNATVSGLFFDPQ